LAEWIEAGGVIAPYVAPEPVIEPEPTKRELRAMLRALKDQNDELNVKIEALK
jgi:hypothetical protein